MLADSLKEKRRTKRVGARRQPAISRSCGPSSNLIRSRRACCIGLVLVALKSSHASTVQGESSLRRLLNDTLTTLTTQRQLKRTHDHLFVPFHSTNQLQLNYPLFPAPPSSHSKALTCSTARPSTRNRPSPSPPVTPPLAPVQRRLR